METYSTYMETSSRQTLQNKAAKIILNAPSLSSATEALSTLCRSPFTSRRYKHRWTFIYKCINGLIDFGFKLSTNNSIHSHNTRSQNNLHLPKAYTNWGKLIPTYSASKDFNNLDSTVKNVNSISKFKTALNRQFNFYLAIY